MSISELPLSYCTNVHAGRSVAEVEAGLDRYTVPVRDRTGGAIAAGLWLARPVVDELLVAPERVARFADGLRSRRLTCHTLNAFPYGDFHSERVKENVYLPDWSRADRLEYTVACARVLAALLPEGVEGSISTLPLGFKRFHHPADFMDAAVARIIECATNLDRLRSETGRLIRLAIEPEPFCILETTPEAIDFFQKLWRQAAWRGAEPAVREHVGLCYDVCHQAVEFEDAPDSIRSLDRTGVRINKVHISCALQLDDPARNTDGREALKRYVEPRYLHQTMARGPDGRVGGVVDLTAEFIDAPGPEFESALVWRVHFHVPVDAERQGPLATTRPVLREALAEVARLPYAPHLEVETYTWEVLPGADKPDLVMGLAREMAATRDLLREIASTAQG
jgi:sugar phosphate isomerase/epimerase